MRLSSCNWNRRETTVLYTCVSFSVLLIGTGRVKTLKEWHNPRTPHKLIRTKLVQDGGQVNFHLRPWGSIYAHLIYQQAKWQGWSSNTLAAWCEELTHWKIPQCWERLIAGDGGDRGWDGWMASSTQCTMYNSGSWRWTGRPGVLQSMGSQRARHDWATELNWIF